MNTHRQLRRQARRARRAGLQPVVVIDRPLPPPVWVVLARWAWRYRSEIAPVVIAGAMLAIGWWLHIARPQLWPFLLVVSDLGALALITLGRRIGLALLAERFYAAVVALAVGGWLAIAAIAGPLASPMLPVLGVGALILAVPWWAHRQRRAWARAQRAIAAWPDVAAAVGLPGARIQFARVDLWGWQAVVRLAPGQTVADVAVRIPVIESALGTYRGAVRVYRTRDDRANLCQLRILDNGPSNEAMPPY
jgi:hypothetical protein